MARASAATRGFVSSILTVLSSGGLLGLDSQLVSGEVTSPAFNNKQRKIKMKLNQIIAVEKGIKSRSHKTLTDMYQTLSKGQLFEGLSRTYEKREEEGQTFPAESTRVQKNANDMLREAGNLLTELFDTTLTKDTANTVAKADVKIGDQVLLAGVPATTLLFLEKQLVELHAFVTKIPVLDPAYDWNMDKNDGLFKTPPAQSAKTRKVTKPLVLYPATPEHPAQTDKITEDVITGYWNQVKMSGAMPESKKKALLGRIEQLQKAVKFAREEANSIEIDQQAMGEKFFNWLFA